MLERMKEIAGLVRDIGLIIGVPTIIAVGMGLYEAQFKAFDQQIKANESQMKVLEAQAALAKETQYDRAAALIKGQKEVYETDRAQIMHRLDELTQKLNNSNSTIQTLTDLQGKVHECIEKVVSLMQDLPEVKQPSADTLKEVVYLHSIMVRICDAEATQKTHN